MAAGTGAAVAGVAEARDGAVRPVTGTHVAVPAECETTCAMTAVPAAADFCSRGGALGFAAPEELP